MFKNDIKKRLGAFNQELWANFKLQNTKFKSYFPLGKRLKKNIVRKSEFIDEKASQSHRNLVKSCFVMGALHTAVLSLCFLIDQRTGYNVWRIYKCIFGWTNTPKIWSKMRY